MNLAEKVRELKEELGKEYKEDVLVGTKVSIQVRDVNANDDGKIRTIEGNFRQFQTNGQANIYLKDYYSIKTIAGKLKRTRWIKIGPSDVTLL